MMTIFMLKLIRFNLRYYYYKSASFKPPIFHPLQPATMTASIKFGGLSVVTRVPGAFQKNVVGGNSVVPSMLNVLTK